MLGKDPNHSNHLKIDSSLEVFKPLWSFDLGDHIWKYTRRRSVWSRSAVSGSIDGETFIFLGSYNHNLFCLEANTGKEVWRFTTGGAINSAPLFMRIAGRPVVLVSSSDRTIYCLDAKTGEKIWEYLVYPWTFTAFEGVPTSAVSFKIEGRDCVVLGFWYADRKILKSLQKGDVLCLDAQTGKEIWRKTISPSLLFSPAILDIKGEPFIFITSKDGNIYCLSAADGAQVWHFTSSIPITSPALAVKVDDKNLVVFGTYFGMIFGIDAENGKAIWKHKVKMQVSSSGAVAKVRGRPVLFIPSYDRNLYALDLLTGKEIWSYPTGQHISAYPVVVEGKDKQLVIFPSLDNKLYLLDAKDRKLLWSAELGGRLWVYETRGETLWPSPIISVVDGKSVIILPWYDGKVYAFSLSE